MIRYSKKREAILTAIRSTTCHPSAEWIYHTLKPTHPDLSLGTVYRNLALLTDLGEIIKITTDGADRFDGHVAPHSHFICRKCHALFDIHMDDEAFIDEKAQNVFPGIIEGHTVQYFGLCEECAKIHTS